MTASSDPSGDAQTLAFYDAKAAEYAPWSSETTPRSWLKKFIAALPAGGRALDYGCGAGWAAAEMAAAGLVVDALDASPALAAEAKRLHGVDVQVAGFEALEADALYDGIWASFSLLHAPRADFPALLARVARALKPGGAFFIGLKGGEGEHRDALGRYYAYYGRDELVGLLTDAGFTGIDAREYEAAAGYDGAANPMIHCIARRA